MKNFKLFKRSALLLAVVALAVVLTVGAIAGAALLSDEGSASYGEKYSAVQVGTSGKVSLKFYYSTVGTADEFVAEITDPETNETKTQYFAVDDLAKTSNGYYCVPVALAPSQMTHTVKIYANGTKGKGEPIAYSVKEYAQDVIADADLADYHDDMRALLNWGAMAQGYFGDAASVLANDDIYARGTNPVSAVKEVVADEATWTNGTTITADKYALSLEPDNIAIHFYVKYTGTGKLTATVERAGLSATTTAVSRTEVEGIYRVRVANVNASLFATPYTVKVTDGTDTCSITASVLNNIASLIAENKEEAMTAKAMYQFYQNVVDGATDAGCDHNAMPYWIANGDGTDSYKCPLCFVQYTADRVPEEVTYFFTPYAFSMAAANTVTADKYIPRSDYNIKKTFEGAYTRISGVSGGDSQILWQRSQQDMYFTQNSGAQQRYSVDVGDADHFVIKMRSTSTKNVYLQISTTGKNSPTSIATEKFLIENKIIEVDEAGKPVVDENGAYNYINPSYDVNDKPVAVGAEYRTTTGYAGIILPAAAGAADEDGFVTYVIDLKAVVPDYYVKEEGSYKIDTLYFHFSALAADANIDIAYMAFAENTESGLDALVDAEKIAKVYDMKGGCGIIDSDTGLCVGEHTANTYTVKTEMDGSQTHRYGCAVCDYTVTTNTVPANVNWYSPLSEMAPMNAGAISKYCYDAENGIVYNEFVSDGPAHCHFTGNTTGGGRWTAGTFDTGEYIVMKYRGECASTVHFFISTFDNGAQTDGRPIWSNIGTRSAAYLPGLDEWETIVIKIPSGVNYTTNDHQRIYLQMTPNGAFTLQVAYVAVVDNLDEARALITDDTYRYLGESYANVGQIMDTETGLCAHVGGMFKSAPVNGTFKLICDECQGVVKEYDVSADSAKRYWSPEFLKTKYDHQGTAVAESAVCQGKYESVTVENENGENFVRFYNASTDTAGGWHGFMMQGAWPSETGRYLVMKIRVGENGFGMGGVEFYAKSKAASKDWTNGYFRVQISEDAEWHTIVVDLATRVANGNYAADATTGVYELEQFQFRPYGPSGICNESNTEFVDIAYMAFCEEIADVADIVGEARYEYSVSDGANATVDANTNECVYHCYVYTDDASTANGYKIVCGACGKAADVNYISYAGGVYQPGKLASCNKEIDSEQGFPYNHFESYASAHYDLLTVNAVGGNGTYTANRFASSRYVAIKYRTTTATINVAMGLSNNETPHTASNADVYSKTEYFGCLPVSEDWNIAIFDMSVVPGYAEGEMLRAAMYVAGVGAGDYLDVAWVAFGDTVDDFDGLAAEWGDKTYKLLTPRFNSIPVYGSFVDDEIDGINWHSTLAGMSCMDLADMTRNQYDEVNDVWYNTISRNGGNHINITGGGGAGSLTSDKYNSGRYIVFKYRVEAAGSLGLYVRTDDYEGRASVGSQANANLPTDEWRVAVVDLSAVPSGRHPASTDANVNNKTYGYTPGIESQLYVMFYPGNTCTLDIAYVAIVDDMDEARSLLRDGENYVFYGTSFANAGCEFNSDGEIVGEHTVEETSNGNTYVYSCKMCNSVLKTVTIPESVTKYYSVKEMITGANFHSSRTYTYGFDDENGVVYYDNDGVIETIWQRSDHDMGSLQTGSSPQQYTVNVGNAKYLVVKVRSTDEEGHMRVFLSTSAKNCAIGTVTEENLETCKQYFKVNDDGTTTERCSAVGDKYYVGGTMITGTYLYTKGNATGEWTTYVIDLEAVYGDYYAKVDGQDYYDVDSFYFLSGGNNDVAYVAFVEGDWSDIAELTGEETVTQITAKNGTSQVVNTADGSAAN